jgi:hypothetical protein
MIFTKNHDRDLFLQPLSRFSFSFRSNLRFFAVFRIFILTIMIFAGLYSCTVLSMTKQTGNREKIAAKSSQTVSKLFDHPLIYIAFPQAERNTVTMQQKKLHKLSQHTLLLLQVSVNSFYLLFLLVLIMFCLALIQDIPAVRTLRQRIFRKKILSPVGTCKEFGVLRYRTTFRKITGFSQPL